MDRDDGKGIELCSYCGTPAFAFLDVHEGKPPEPFCAVCALAVLGSTVAHAAKDSELVLPDFPAMHDRSHVGLSISRPRWCRHRTSTDAATSHVEYFVHSPIWCHLYLEASDDQEKPRSKPVPPIAKELSDMTCAMRDGK